MHGFRIAIYGGVTANPSPIAVRATREGSERSTCPGLGDILGDQEVAISCSGGNDLPAKGCNHRAAETRCRVPARPSCERRTARGKLEHLTELIHHRPGVALRMGVAET